MLYVKPTFKGKDPVDVYHYSRENNAFPHETTADQWFSEAQFESYRRLGELAADELQHWLSSNPPAWLEQVFHATRRRAEKVATAKASATQRTTQGKPRPSRKKKTKIS